MDSHSLNLALLGLVILSLAIAGLVANLWLCTRIAQTGGKVAVEKFGLVDVILCLLLFSYLSVLVVAGFRTPDRPIHDSDLIDNAIVELFIMAALCSFLHFRGFNLADQFGLRLRPDKAAGLAILLLLAFYPIGICAAIVTQAILGPETKPQELIKLFSEAAQHMNYRTLIYTAVTGLVIAPVFEELVFRGYIYAILKRYLGITAGVVLNAALFAAIHVNMAALPPLFLFAVCLTLAYEFTGSILVNICMHVLFNFCALSVVFYLASHPQ